MAHQTPFGTSNDAAKILFILQIQTFLKKIFFGAIQSVEKERGCPPAQIMFTELHNFYIIYIFKGRYVNSENFEIMSPPQKYFDYICGVFQNEMDKVLSDRIEANRKEYERLMKDDNYTDVRFNQKNGALAAIHREHNFDPKKGKYEKCVLEVGYNNGNAVIFGSETGESLGIRYTDGLWNGKSLEITAAETGTSNNIKKGLNHCASKPKVKVAILFFPNDNFEIATFENAFARYTGIGKSGGKGYVEFDDIICIDSNKILYIKKKAT